MPSEFSVREFLDLELYPAQKTWEEVRLGPIRARRLPALVLVETFGWIRLGVQSETFPEDLTRDLLDKSWDLIREANEFTEKEKLLAESVIGENRRLIEKKSFPRPFRGAYKSDFSELPEAPIIFSLWSGEARSFSRFRSGIVFVDTLNYANEKEWDEAVARLIDENFDPNPKDSKVSLFEGYLRALQHLDRIADLLHVEEIAPEKWPALAIMRIEMGSIHGWRLNFQSSVFEPRFRQVTEVVEERLRREAIATGSKPERGGFVEGVRDLTRRYLSAFGPLPASATATV